MKGHHQSFYEFICNAHQACKQFFIIWFSYSFLNPHTEFLLSITIWLSYPFWGVKLKYVINTIIYLTLLYFWFCRMGWICETDLIGFRKKIGEWKFDSVCRMESVKNCKKWIPIQAGDNSGVLKWKCIMKSCHLWIVFPNFLSFYIYRAYFSLSFFLVCCCIGTSPFPAFHTKKLHDKISMVHSPLSSISKLTSHSEQRVPPGSSIIMRSPQNGQLKIFGEDMWNDFINIIPCLAQNLLYHKN